MSYSTKPQSWYWILAIIFLLWNLMGVGAWTNDFFNYDENIKQMSQEMQNLMNGYDSWYMWAYFTAVITGLAACIALIFKKKIAVLLSVISLLAVVLCKGYDLSKGAWDIYPSVIKFFTIAVPILSITLWLFARSAKSKGWLR